VQLPGSSGRKEVQGMVKLAGDTYGPMENYYVSPRLYSLLNDHIEQLATFEAAAAMASSNPLILLRRGGAKAFDVWGNVAGTSKMMQIILNPMNYAYNFGGGWEGQAA